MSLSNSLRVRGLSGTLELALCHLFNPKRVPGHILSRMVDLRRYDRKHGTGLAFSPVLKPSFHTPERFGWLEF